MKLFPACNCSNRSIFRLLIAGLCRSILCMFHLSSFNSPVLVRQYISRVMPVSLMILVHKQSRCLGGKPEKLSKENFESYPAKNICGLRGYARPWLQMLAVQQVTIFRHRLASSVRSNKSVSVCGGESLANMKESKIRKLLFISWWSR